MNRTSSIPSLLLRRLLVYLLAVGVAYGLAVAAATQSVISSLSTMGIPVSLGERFSMTLRDLAGMAPMFLPMVAFGLLCAFMTAALLCRWRASWRIPLYVLAGAAGVVTIHLLLHLAFQITPVAAARSPGGLLLQGLAGAAGGLAYISLRRSRFSG